MARNSKARDVAVVVTVVVVWQRHDVVMREHTVLNPQPTPRRSKLEIAKLSIPPPLRRDVIREVFRKPWRNVRCSV